MELNMKNFDVFWDFWHIALPWQGLFCCTDTFIYRLPDIFVSERAFTNTTTTHDSGGRNFNWTSENSYLVPFIVSSSSCSPLLCLSVNACPCLDLLKITALPLWNLALSGNPCLNMFLDSNSWSLQCVSVNLLSKDKWIPLHFPGKATLTNYAVWIESCLTTWLSKQGPTLHVK